MHAPLSSGVTGTRVGGCLVVTVTRDLAGGTLDEVRRAMLEGVREGGVHAVALEVTAVPYMDSREFDEVRRSLRMVELLGARTMLVGLAPGIIAHLMAADADVSGIRASLGLDEALREMKGRADA